MRRLDQDHDQRRRVGAAGFTLIELLVVIAIIGLIISLILVAAADGVRRAEEKATQALITKLETGLNDRLDALLGLQAPINQTHRYLAAINYTPDGGTTYGPVGSDDRRSQTFAQFDFIRSELPDVFLVNASTSNGSQFASAYPLNFGAAPYPPGNNNLYNYVLPVGVGYDLSGNPGGAVQPAIISTATFVPGSNQVAVSGMFGASFSAAGGIYKNLFDAAISDLAAATPPVVVVANPPLGYDGVDNNGNGYIDEMGEVSTDQNFVTAVTSRLTKHTHKTARAEMLYALLVEGLGPLGSVYNRDDFTSREVQDTDGDGLPEFVDAWGEPLLFFRWPIYFGGQQVAGSSDLQKGSEPYNNGYPEYRELDPLDTNQLLVSPGWFSLLGNPRLATPLPNMFAPPNGSDSSNAVQAHSQGALAFMNYFHSLVDPNPYDTSNGTSWDRTGYYSRRAYFSKFLVLSAGPDREPGVAQFGKNYDSLANVVTDPAGLKYRFPFVDISGQPTPIEFNLQRLIFIENQASQSDPYSRTGSFFEVPAPISANPFTQFLQSDVGLDDISNHNIQAPSTGVR